MVDAARHRSPAQPGHLRITGPSPSDPIEIVANTFSDPADMKALIRAVELCREMAIAPP
jgi:choline dehydrogenase